MDAQETVFQRYPDAEARQEPPIYQHGESTPIEQGYWGIFSGSGFDDEEIGRGHSEDKAWVDAADRLASARREAA